MTVMNDTNKGRVSKIDDMLGLIAKSAESNKATQEELWELLGPVIDTIQGMLKPEARPEAPNQEDESDAPAPQTTQKEAGWSEIYEIAQKAPLHELSRAVAVFHNRVDELIASVRK